MAAFVITALPVNLLTKAMAWNATAARQDSSQAALVMRAVKRAPKGNFRARASKVSV
jgi:hypothetical protein